VEAISGDIQLKAMNDTSQSTSTSTAVVIKSATVKMYPSGGYILVYELTRTTSKIVLNYKQVHTSCGNPATTALSPATSSPVITNLAPGSYNIEIIANGVVNKGTLNVPVSPGSPTLLMQTSNGIIVQ
jgi:hypothetical protein